MLCGGTSETHEATEEIQALIDQVRSDLEAKVGKVFPHYKAISYKSQVVAGTNYFVKIQTDGSDFIHVRIFKSLPHAGSKVEVHSHKTGKTKDDAIEYF
ncbi:hypothetical protein BsWGS_13188 [Bradybaena similaris]